MLVALNEASQQPAMNLSLARVYLRHSDPAASTRTWQTVIDEIIRTKTGENQNRWITAGKSKSFDSLRHRVLIETQAEHLLHVLQNGTVSTNVYLRRIHNHALGMEWLLRSVIPRLQWPRPVFKAKRAITAEEHAAIVTGEVNAERRDFYELLWHTGAAQSDAACLLAADVDWTQRTLSCSRKKLKGRAGIKPALIRFGAEVESILRRRPSAGSLFPYLCTVR